MTEKEKQQAGELYDASDRELFTERVKARKLCGEFNALEYNDFQKRERIIDRTVALKGENVTIEAGFLCNYGYNIVIGNNFHADVNCILIDNAEITFGDNVYVGPNCCFCTAERPLDSVTRNTGLERAKPIKVGNNVCFGSSVTVAAGITIGNNVVIAAGSVVTKDIPSDCIAAGNPCLPTKITERSAHHEAPKKPEEKQAAPAAPAAQTSSAAQNTKAAPPSMEEIRPVSPENRKPSGPRHLEVRRVENPNNGGSGFPDRRK